MPLTYKADTQIFTPFSDYIAEETLLRNSIIRSGIATSNPLIQQLARSGEDLEIPNWDPDLPGDGQRPEEGVDLTVRKLGSNKQRGVIHHCREVWGSSELAALAVGSSNDPQRAIGDKVAEKVTNIDQSYLLATLSGVFGPLGSSNSSAAFAAMSIDATGSGESDLSAQQVARGEAILGEKARVFGSMIISPEVYAFLKVRQAIEYIPVKDMPGITASTAAAAEITGINAVGGSSAGMFGGAFEVPTFCGKILIVSDDCPRSGSGAATKYGVYMFRPGAVGFGDQKPLRIAEDETFLSESYLIKAAWDKVYHPLGATYSGPVNPLKADLATVGNWAPIFDKKNIGVVRLTVTCPITV